MASIAKYVRDPEVKAILKKKDDGKKGEHGGIGTTATRGAILEKLKERGYLEEEHKGKTVLLRSTEKARAFYHLLPPEIAGADVTRAVGHPAGHRRRQGRRERPAKERH